MTRLVSLNGMIQAGVTASLSLAILPYLPSFILFNVAENIGLKRIISRLIFFPLGIIFAFVISCLAIWLQPAFFIANSSKLDIIWALIVLYLSYIVIKTKNAFVIRAARDMYVYWCFGTFLMGAVFGAVWVNYLSTRSVEANLLFQNALFGTNIAGTFTDAAYYSTGIAVVVALVGLATFAVAYPFRNLLAKQRDNIKLVCGGVIGLFAAYIIWSDLWVIFTASRAPF